MNPTPTRRLGAFATLGRAIRKDRRALSGALIMAVFVLIAIVGPALVGDPTALVGVPLQPPSWAHLLGTNGQGQDVLAQLVVGTRISLAIGFAVGLLVVVVGALIGAYGRRVLGVKDSSGDLAYERLLAERHKGFAVYPANEATLLEGREGGKFAGCISATTNLNADLCARALRRRSAART